MLIFYFRLTKERIKKDRERHVLHEEKDRERSTEYKCLSMIYKAVQLREI